MRKPETNLTARGITSVPKAVRQALGATHGACLRWEVQPDGSIRVTVKHVYAPPVLEAPFNRLNSHEADL